MKNMKKLLGIILSLSLVLGMIIPSINTKAEGAEAFDFSTIAGINASFSGELLEADAEEVGEPSPNGQVNFMGYNIHSISLSPTFVVTYNNGTPADVFHGWNEINEGTRNKYGRSPMFRTNQDTRPWEVGINKVQVTFGNGEYNFECEADVTVKENPIEGISVVATEALYEGETVPRNVWDEQTQQLVECEMYNLHETDPEITLTMKNGSSQTYKISKLMEVFGENVQLTSDQSLTNKWKAGKHTVTAKFMARTCEFEVEIKENPIINIDVVAKSSLYEGETVQQREWNEETQQEVFYDAYDINAVLLEVTITLKDGTNKTYNDWELYEVFERSLNISTDQSPTNKWGIGKHTATAQFMGKTCDFEVEIVEHPIKSIAGKYHGTVVEGTGVSIDESKIEYIFTFADGSVGSYYKYEEVLGQQIAPSLVPLDLLNNGTWSAGKHYFAGTILGKEVKVEVDVKSKSEVPIKEISAVATKDLVADWHWGSYGDGAPRFLQVDNCDPSVTVTYQDGTQETFWYSALQTKFNGVEPTLRLDDTSLEGVGKRTATIDFYGQTDTFEVNVIENPVESISAVTTKQLVKDWRMGTYSLIYDSGLIITVNYKDGTKISGTVNELIDKLNAYPDDTDNDFENAVVGKNIAKLDFLNRTCNVEYEVIEDPNPVVGIEAKVQEGAVLYEKVVTAEDVRYNYGHLIDVVLKFKDGSKLTGTLDEVNQQLEYINIKEVFAFDEQVIEAWGIGKHAVTIAYEEFQQEVEVEVVANPYSKVTISNADGLTIVLQKVNGATETYKATKFSPSGSSGNSYNMFGYIETNKETLPVEVRFAGGRNSDYSNVVYMIINGVKSNSLQKCEWLEQQMIVQMNGVVPQTMVNNSASELKELVLTEGDYKKGTKDSMTAWLSVSEKQDVSAEEQAVLKKAKEGTLDQYEDGVIVDLTLYKQYTDAMTQQIVTEKVPEPNGKVSITMEVPAEILASGTNPENIKMVRIHNGETTVIPCTYNKETKTITFETNKFSTYSMVYEVADKGTNDGPGGGTGSGDNLNAGGTGTSTTPPSSTKAPNTGDTNVVMGYSIMCIVALAAIVVMKRRNSFAK